jgi:hypothetical protein
LSKSWHEYIYSFGTRLLGKEKLAFFSRYNEQIKLNYQGKYIERTFKIIHEDPSQHFRGAFASIRHILSKTAGEHIILAS